MLETSTAGSLPKPFWLAKPKMLWAPWAQEGAALAEAKRDATLLVLKEQETPASTSSPKASNRGSISFTASSRRSRASISANA
jgi:hypothetical protein